MAYAYPNHQDTQSPNPMSGPSSGPASGMSGNVNASTGGMTGGTDPGAHGAHNQGIGLRASGLGAHLHTLGQGIGYTSQGLRRKASGEGLDVLKDFKDKIHEDENYIEFFQERIRIEEQYIAQLQKLYDRTVAKDSLQDDQSGKTQTPTARRAWAEVRDYTSREIDSRNAMAQAIRAAVVPDLIKTRDEQERIRLGLKDNMRAANDMYDEHARYQLPKLKKSYWAKCQLLEDHKRQEAAIAAQARLLAESSNPTSPMATPAHEFPPNLQSFSPPTSTPPLPPISNPSLESSPNAGPSGAHYPSHSQSLHVMYSDRPDRQGHGRASISGGSGMPPPAAASSAALGGGGLSGNSGASGGRARSGSASGAEKKDPKEVFQDLAVQGKKGFKDFMQRLGGDRDKEKERDKDGDGFVLVNPNLATLGKEDDALGLQRKGTGGRGKSGGETGALKGVRLKREADEADKAYRAGVFHLESLRIRRDKVFASALTNLEQFNDDLTLQLRNSLSTYVDIVHATAATNMQATEVARAVVSKVDAERDMMYFRSRLSGVKSDQTAPIPYENFYVGSCKSLIFGVSLTDYDFARGEGGDHGRPPIIVEKCIAAVDERGLNLEGLYRISGRKAAGQQIVQEIELDEGKFAFEEKDDVHAVASVLKQYLRELPEPVFNLPHAERIKYTESREANISNNFAALRARLRRLPPIHQTTFQAIIEHLGRVQSRSASNKMDAKNIAVIFNTVIFGPDQVPLDANALSMHHGRDTVLEDLITYADLLFSADKETSPSSSAPSHRPGVKSEYGIMDGAQPGSSRTKLQIVNPTLAASHGREQDIAGAVLRAGDAAAGHATPDQPSQQSRRGTGTDAELADLASVTMYTPDEELELLFDPKLVPAALQRDVGAGYHARPLSSSDLMRSHFSLLSDLSESPPIAPSTYAALFQHLRACATTYYIIVIVDKSNDQLVASATLFVERKYIHGGGIAGHIEDVVVSNRAQGRGLGAKLVKGLKELGESVGCYKTILDCQEGKVGFYEKCGFTRRGVQMAFYSAMNKGAAAPVPASPLVTLSPSQLPVRHDSVPLSSHLARQGSVFGKSPRSASLGFTPSPQSAGSLHIPSIIDLTNSNTPSMDALEESRYRNMKRYSQQSESSTSGSGSTGSRVTYTVAPQMFTQVTATASPSTTLAPPVRADGSSDAEMINAPQETPKAISSPSFSSPPAIHSPFPLPPRIARVQQENKADQQMDEDDVLKHVPAWATPGLGASVLQPRRLSAQSQANQKRLSGESAASGRSPSRKTHSRSGSRDMDLGRVTSGGRDEGLACSLMGSADEEKTERAHTPLPPGAAPAERDAEPERVKL